MLATLTIFAPKKVILTWGAVHRKGAKPSRNAEGLSWSQRASILLGIAKAIGSWASALGATLARWSAERPDLRARRSRRHNAATVNEKRLQPGGGLEP